MYLKSKITSSVLIGYNISLGIHRHVGCWKCSLAYYIVEYRGLPPTPLFSPPLLLLARKCTIIGTESLIPPCWTDAVCLANITSCCTRREPRKRFWLYSTYKQQKNFISFIDIIFNKNLHFFSHTRKSSSICKWTRDCPHLTMSYTKTVQIHSLGTDTTF